MKNRWVWAAAAIGVAGVVAFIALRKPAAGQSGIVVAPTAGESAPMERGTPRVDSPLGGDRIDHATPAGTDRLEAATRNPPSTEAKVVTPSELPVDEATPQITPEQRAELDHLDEYFRKNKVKARLRQCLGSNATTTTGKVVIRLDYRLVDGQFVPTESPVEAIDSTLSGEQDDLVLRCMSHAIQGTSFAPTEMNKNQPIYAIYQPVIFPLADSP